VSRAALGFGEVRITWMISSIFGHGNGETDQDVGAVARLVEQETWCAG